MLQACLRRCKRVSSCIQAPEHVLGHVGEHSGNKNIILTSRIALGSSNEGIRQNT